MLHFNIRESLAVEVDKLLEEGNDALNITKKTTRLTEPRVQV
jgi:hypothetical protein